MNVGLNAEGFKSFSAVARLREYAKDVHIRFQCFSIGVTALFGERVQALTKHGLPNELECCPCHVLRHVDLLISSHYERLYRLGELSSANVSAHSDTPSRGMAYTVSNFIERWGGELEIFRREDRVQQLALPSVRTTYPESAVIRSNFIFANVRISHSPTVDSRPGPKVSIPMLQPERLAR